MSATWQTPRTTSLFRLIRPFLYGGAWRRRTRVAMVAAAWALYGALYVALHASAGPGLAALSAVPVVVAGTLLGVRWGLLSGVAALPINTLLVNLGGAAGWDAVLRGGGLPGSLVVVCLGAGVGWLRELTHRIQCLTQQLQGQLERQEVDRLAAIERARLEGVLLAARTAEHELNNRLSATLGYASLLAEDPTLPEHLRRQALDVVRGAKGASEVVNRLRTVTRLHETAWGPWIGTTIDLKRSTE